MRRRISLSQALMTEKRRAFRQADPRAYRGALLKKARRVRAEKRALKEAFGFQLRPRRRTNSHA
jgi:hypothetical protein